MLIEAGILLAAYGGTRLFEKFRDKLPKNVVTNQPDRKIQPSVLEKSVDDTDKKLVVHDKADKQLEHRLKTSYVSMVVSTIRQFFYSSPLLVLLNLGLYVYNSIPYMKEAEKTLLKEQKLSGHMIETILIFAAIATNQYLAASFMEMIYYLSGKIKAKTQDKSKDMLINVFEQQPRNVWVLKDSVEVEVPLEAVHINDIVVVNTGEVVPVDGIIIDGMATIDQHALTGESQPAEKSIGDQVFAATTMMTGRIHVQIEKAGIDTTIAQIGQILNHTTDFKTTAQLKAEKWADEGAWPQLGITGLALLAVGPIGATAVLNTNFGYRIKLSGPLGTLNYLNLASHHSILIKDGRSLELLTGIDTILFDKTGTLTQEQPEVGKIVICDGYEADDILAYAAAAECKLAHPIAKAIVQKAKGSNLSLPDIEDSNYQIGYGITVSIKNRVIKVGSLRFMTMEGMTIPETIEKAMAHSHAQGYSLVMVAINNQIEGAIEIQPALRPEIKSIISGLRQRGIKYLAIVSGDHKQPTQKLAEELGMDNYFYDILPENKAKIVEKLQQEGKSVCFIGDGVNDAVAMKKANVSISIRGATSIATDLAQVVFMDGSLSHLCKLFDIANGLDSQLRKSLIISLIPLPINLIGILFLHFSLLSTIVINQMSFWSGIGDAMLPLKKIENDKRST
ncbi:MAG: heavy metal translocating P-type ATPase [Candidatus Parabeggiatoa sp. nov. 1]|nr:MAG: heavy metal translocating P-type ATPase [Gammaproteobacteria bacterium]